MTKVYSDKQTTVDTYEDKKHQLFLKQKKLLETFLEHGVISTDQFDMSLTDLAEKMGESD